MKTIFIAILNGVEGKNIVRSSVYATLRKESDVRIIFLFRNKSLSSLYESEFADKGTFFEILPPFKKSLAEKFFSRLKFYLLRSETTDLHRLTNLEEGRNYAVYFSSLVFNRVFARPIFRRLVRALDFFLIRQKELDSLFEKYRPAEVFLADLFSDTETAILRESKRRKILSVGLINTWDRVTTRWMIRLLPDCFITFNEIVKKELKEYDDFSPDRSYVSGTVQHDHLITGKFSGREEFCHRLGIDPESRIIVYAPLGSFFDKTRPELDKGLVKILSEAALSGQFSDEKITILVRFHPNDLVDLAEWPTFPNVVYSRPGLKFATELSDKVFSRTRGQKWDLSFDDLSLLRDTIYHSALVVCYYTSFSIYAAVLDKPVINVNFDIRDGWIISKPHPYYNSVHYQKAAATLGIRLVSSEEDFFSAIKKYLADSSLHKEQRQRLVNEQCFKLDGHSGERVAKFLLSRLY